VLNVSQEQQEQEKLLERQEPIAQQMPSETSESAQTAIAPKKKRIVKKVVKIDEAAISPRPSYWPVVLALALVVLLVGSITHIIVLGIGVALVVISILGWSFERR
jgi:hypothetical protein